MKKTIRLLFVTALVALSGMPALAQQLTTGYYRFRNYASSNDYISMTNDMFNYTTCIGTACGGLKQALTDAGKARALACAGKFLQTDIHLVNDADFIDPATVIYVKKRNTNSSNYEYNLIGQGTSLLTLTTGTYPSDSYPLEFTDRYVTIKSTTVNGATVYTASIELKSSTYVFLYGYPSLGVRYLEDSNNKLALNTSSSANNAKWYAEPITHFNVVPEVELHGKYYTTIKVPFDFTLSGQVLKAYAITAVENDILSYNVIATNGGTVPAGTPVLLECGSANPADCQLIPGGAPIFTDPDVSITAAAPRANETSSYTGQNLLGGTYYCNTDGSQTFETNGGTSSFNANRYTSTSGKYVVGFTTSGKLGFVAATGTAMPANKAWLALAKNAVFPIVATPTFAPEAGEYTEGQTVTITAEDGATILYSLDGGTTWNTYEGAIEVAESMTIQAKAVKDGLFNDSEVANAEYVISIPDPELTVTPTMLTINDLGGSFTVSGSYLGTDDVGVTTNNGFATTTTDQSWGFLNNNGSVNGTVTVTYEGRELNATGTVNVANNLISKHVDVNYVADLYIVTDNGIEGQWNFNDGTPMPLEDGVYTTTFTTTAENTFILFARKLGNDVTWNTRYVFGPSSDGNWVMPNQATEYGTIDLNDDDPIKLPIPGEYTITINPSDGSFSITRKIETVATPTFSLESGEYTGEQSVVIACETDNATIHYTTDGSDPDENSPVYTDTITVDQSMTIKAIAMKPYYNNSEVAVATYVITPLHKPGDVNHDGKITIKDVTLLINYLLTDDPEGVCLTCADVSQDESITIKDVTALINILLTSTDE